MSHIRNTPQRILSYLSPFWRVACLGILANILYASIDAGFTYMMRPFVDKTFINLDIEFLYHIPWIILAGITLRGFMGGLGGYCMTYVSRSMVNALRQAIFDKLNHLPAQTIDAIPSGQLLSKLLYDVEQVAQVSADTLTDIIQYSCLILGLLGVMFVTSWQLSTVFLFAIPGIALLVSYTNRRIRRISRKAQQSMGEVTEIAGEVIDGYREVRMFEAQDFISQRFSRAAEASRRHDLKAAMSKAINVFGVQIILAITSCFIILISIWLARKINITPGMFITIAAAMLQLIKPMKSLTTLNVSIQRGLAGAESVFQVLDLPEEINSHLPALNKVQGDIEFKAISFAFHHQNWVIENLNMKIKAGQTAAIVGSSGSGKTTLIHLLPRFYDVEIGSILIDGQPIQNYSLNSLRQQFSWVGQHVILFNDTVAKNIAYGQTDIDEKRMWSAILQANAQDFIQKLPQGLNTLIGKNGHALSGGQRQRLALARAIYKNAPILILDEATAALDNRTERAIQHALEEFHHHRTMIIIAHRLSTIKFADVIFVMHEGKIIEQGSHQELLTLNGHYASLYYAQHQTKNEHQDHETSLTTSE